MAVRAVSEQTVSGDTSPTADRHRSWRADELVALEGATVRYRRARRDAVRDLTLAVHRGEVVGLVGPNGAGKTTALRALCGFAPLRRGTRRVSSPMRVAALLAPSLLTDGFDVDGCVRNLWRVVSTAPFPRTLYDELADALNVAELGSLPIGWLSLGQRQRVSIAACLLHRPDLLVLDEPFGPLDPDERIRLGATLAAIADAGGAVVLSSHDLTTAVGCGTRIVVIDEGEVVDDSDLMGEVRVSYRISYRIGSGRDRRLRSAEVNEAQLDRFLAVVAEDEGAVLLGVEPTFSSGGAGTDRGAGDG